MTPWGKLTRSVVLLSALTGTFPMLHPISKIPAVWGVEGFGGGTPGGAGQPVYHVQHLNDSGMGSLRDAVAQGHRYIVFDVGGEIKLSQDVWVKGAFLTIDGTSAPAPGITLKYGALLIHGSSGAHDIVVRGLRSRQAMGCDTCATTGAGMGIGAAAYNVVLDQVSVAYAQDQALSIDGGAHDVTVQASIFAESQSPDGKNLPVLVAYGAQRISFHHNLFLKGYERLPQVKYADNGRPAPDTQVDLRNNLVWDWGYAGMQIWKGARANLVNNYYYDPNAGENGKKLAIYFCTATAVAPQCDGTNPAWYARAYIAGNVSGHGPAISDYLNGLGTEAQAFAAPPVSTTDACTAAQQVLASAGTSPRDAVDQSYLSQVKPVGCAAPVPAPTSSGVDSVNLEGEDFDGKSSNLWVAAGKGEAGDDAIGMNHNAWAAYNGVDFDGLTSVNVRVASGNQGGTISFRTGSSSGPVIGSLSFGNTGSWNTWVTRTATLRATTGTQVLYLTFTNAATGGGQMMLLDWLELAP